MRVLGAHRWRWLILTATLIAIVFALEVLAVGDFVVDDSYITFAFSKNLARGHGPVYGQDMVVEGYSNFLWMALVAGPLAFLPRVDPLVIARVLMVPFALMLFAGTYFLARTKASRLWSALAVLLIALDVNTTLAFLCGLESLPYAALTTLGFCLYAHADSTPRARTWVMPVFTAAALTRIDGFAPLAFIMLWEALRSWWEGRFSARALARWALPWIAIWVVWFAWRWWYYGMPLPSTYYAKKLIPALLPRRGLEYVYDELAGSGIWLAAAAIGFLLWQRVRAALPIALFAIAQVGYAAHVGGDWMAYGRFVMPAVPLFVVLLAWAADGLVAAVGPRRAPRVGAWAFGLAVFAFVGLSIEPAIVRSARTRDKLAFARDQTDHVARLKKAAGFLAQIVPPGGRLVTDYGGVLAQFTEATPIEMWGLCNATIATKGNAQGVNPIYGRTCPACYPALDPEYFHVWSPLIRAPGAFASHQEVVSQVWQSDTIGRHVDLGNGFASGRLTDVGKGEALWFLQRRSVGARQPRVLPSGLVLEYPFEPGGCLGAAACARGPASVN